MKRSSRLTFGAEGYASRIALGLGALVVGGGIWWLLFREKPVPPAPAVAVTVPIAPPAVIVPNPAPPRVIAPAPRPRGVARARRPGGANGNRGNETRAPAGPPAIRTLDDLAQNAPAPPAGIATPPAFLVPSAGASVPPNGAAPRLNTTGHPITLTIPLKDGQIYLGDIAVTIEPDDRVEFSSQRLLDLLTNVLTAPALDLLRAALAGKAIITPADLAGTGIAATYNPQTLELVLAIPPQMRAARDLAISALDRERFGNFVQPAKFSAYLNARGSIDYVYQGSDRGLSNPVFFFDGAARSHGVALESEAVWQPGSSITSFQRQGTRLVYDDLDRIVRWTAGDLVPVGEGFQSVPDLLGFSAFRSYGVLQPQRIVRPHGDRAFQLTRASNVEISVNGQIVRRLRLDPGTYNLQDFPFTQGANDVAVSINDDAGRQEVLRFNVFFDQTQLDPGLSEFGFFAGAKSPLAASGPHYTDAFALTGFYRRGVAEDLTFGGNVQADKHTAMTALEGLWGSPIGTIGFDVATSFIKDYGSGYAVRLTLQRLFQFSQGQGDSFNLSAEARSRDFGPMGTLVPSNLYAYELGAAYTHAFSNDFYAGVDAHFSKGRDGEDNVGIYSVSGDYRLTPDLGLSTSVGYEDSGIRRGVNALVSLTMRLSPSSAGRAEYDTAENRSRLSYQMLQGEGVGSYNVAADLERTGSDSGFNANVNYYGNRAELGASHFTTFDGTFGGVRDQRSSAQVATSFAYADGAVAMGRPIYDSFAIVQPHPSLQGAQVLVNPTPYSFTASTDSLLDTALENDLSAYAERTVAVDVPDAPQGYDLGAGAFRLFPPHRGGYVLQVGSDYSITAIGRLLTSDGAPVALLAGRAVEIAEPDREPVTIFTNRDGRFGAAGLRPGRWRLEMPTVPASVYILDVPADAVGVVRTGDLKPAAAAPNARGQ